MKIYFDNILKVEPEEFLETFERHIRSRKTTDATEEGILGELRVNTSFYCYKGGLNQTGLDNFILPQHAVELEPGADTDREVQPGGEPFRRVIAKYYDNYVPNLRFPASLGKIFGQQFRFFHCDDPLLKADFLFVCNRREYAHPGDDHYHSEHGKNKLYMGNGFHRFIGYGMWIQKYGFKPIEVFYVEFP